MAPQDGVDHLLRAAPAPGARARPRRRRLHADGRRRLVRGPARPGRASSSSTASSSSPGASPTPRSRRVLATADVCVSPDPRNPLNDVSTMNKVLEYMACGRPIVAFDLREHRASAGEGALYAEPNRDEDLADKIATLLDDPERRARDGRRTTGSGSSTAWRGSTTRGELIRAYEALWRPDGAVSVLLVESGRAVGGTERVVWELATRLPEHRFDVRVWLSDAAGVDELAAALEARGVGVDARRRGRLALGLARHACDLVAGCAAQRPDAAAHPPRLAGGRPLPAGARARRRRASTWWSPSTSSARRTRASQRALKRRELTARRRGDRGVRRGGRLAGARLRRRRATTCAWCRTAPTRPTRSASGPIARQMRETLGVLPFRPAVGRAPGGSRSRRATPCCSTRWRGWRAGPRLRRRAGGRGLAAATLSSAAPRALGLDAARALRRPGRGDRARCCARPTPSCCRRCGRGCRSSLLEAMVRGRGRDRERGRRRRRGDRGRRHTAGWSRPATPRRWPRRWRTSTAGPTTRGGWARRPPSACARALHLARASSRASRRSTTTCSGSPASRPRTGPRVRRARRLAGRARGRPMTRSAWSCPATGRSASCRARSRRSSARSPAATGAARWCSPAPDDERAARALVALAACCRRRCRASRSRPVRRACSGFAAVRRRLGAVRRRRRRGGRRWMAEARAVAARRTRTRRAVGATRGVVRGRRRRAARATPTCTGSATASAQSTTWRRLAFYRRDALATAGGYDPRLNSEEDFELGLRCARLGLELRSLGRARRAPLERAAAELRRAGAALAHRAVLRQGQVLRLYIGRPGFAHAAAAPALLSRDAGDVAGRRRRARAWAMVRGDARPLAAVGRSPRSALLAVMAARKRSVRLAIHSLLTWTVNAAGMVVGFVGPPRPAAEREAARDRPRRHRQRRVPAAVRRLAAAVRPLSGAGAPPRGARARGGPQPPPAGRRGSGSAASSCCAARRGTRR